MNCTCKEWNSETAKSFLPMEDRGKFSFCPWCGSPLLPDAVEKTELVIFSEPAIYHSGLHCGSTDPQKALRDLESSFPTHTHTLKSITTIEKTVKIVRPK